MDLSTPMSALKRVGSVTSKSLASLGITTIADLLAYFPFRYDDYRASSALADVQPGQTVTVTAQIELIQNKRSPRRRMNITEALVNDGTESLRVIWFNQPFLTRNLKPGDIVSLAGRVGEDYGGPIMTSPVYEKVTQAGAIHTKGLVPVYHLTADLTQKAFRSIMAQVVNAADQLPDWLPAEIVRQQRLMSLGAAVKQIHFPQDEKLLATAKHRLGFNELLLVQLRSQRQRLEFMKLKAPAIAFDQAAVKRLVRDLPFDLTDDQKKAAWEIIRDLEKETPMLRLLQGDVGSGKTVVAALALLNTARAGYQGALMVPTEILAFQHFETLSKKILVQEGLSIALLTGSYSLLSRRGEIEKISKKKLLEQIAAGEAQLVLGTHALIQQGVSFKNLALAVIDEQHRFGVEQRSLLSDKIGEKNENRTDNSGAAEALGGRAVHLLSMTATPIPRSLALALYGDLDVSIIRQMPVGRKPVITKLVGEKQRAEAYEFIARQLDEGRQAFVVCPLIDPSDKTGARSVAQEFKRLNETVFKRYAVGLLHGRIKSTERERTMGQFAAGEMQLLVTTSVIESGVDIPNATVMMIEDADRFGLAQLHQYRGRVGRGSYQSYCFLMSGADDGAQSRQRLEALVNLNDGFELARVDLKFRGPGEVYGLAQKGFPELRMANFYDVALIKQAREAALAIISTDPNLERHSQLREELGEWEQRAHLE